MGSFLISIYFSKLSLSLIAIVNCLLHYVFIFILDGNTSASARNNAASEARLLLILLFALLFVSF